MPPSHEPPPPSPTGRPRTTAGQMRPLSELLSTGLPSDDQIEVRDHVHRIALAWSWGELPRSAVRRQCTGHERFTAMRFTTPGTAEYAAMTALTNDLIDHEHEVTGQPAYRTRFGIFGSAEIEEAAGKLSALMQDGRRIGTRILFAIRHPWRVRPDAANGVAGEPAEPLYAETFEQRQAIATNRTVTVQRGGGIADRW